MNTYQIIDSSKGRDHVLMEGVPFDELAGELRDIREERGEVGMPLPKTASQLWFRIEGTP